jgi:4-hydroxybenzoyl-CoA reductase subunit beta
MLRLPEFKYITPRSLKEAARVLSDLGPQALPVAGGTDVFPKMKRGQFTPQHLLSLKSLPELKGIRPENEQGLWIGAGETLADVSRHRVIEQWFPALTHAAGSVATPQLRNMGTIGGNLFVDTRCNYYDQSHFWRQAAGFCMKKDGDTCLVAPGSDKCLAVFSSDTAPVMLSLKAKAVLESTDGARTVGFDQLYRDDGIDFTAKRDGELLHAIVIPRESARGRNIYLKLRRRDSFDFPVLGVAAAMSQTRDGVCTSARIVLTAVSSCPKVAEEAARLLEGKRVNAELIERAAVAAANESHPVDNTDMSQWYRKRMTTVYVARALAALAGLRPHSS